MRRQSTWWVRGILASSAALALSSLALANPVAGAGLNPKPAAQESAPQEPSPQEPGEAPANEPTEVAADEEPVRTFDRQNSVILHALDPVKAQAQAVTVAVLSGTRKNYVALGTIVDSNGLILTKASELRGDLRCRLADGRELAATVFGIHKPTDLAMLKIDANGLPSANWSTSDPPLVGYWLISPRAGLTPKLGIVSVLPRAIPSPSGFMGVNLAQADHGVRVTRVMAKSPAEKAGVLINDVIVGLNGEPKTEQIDLITSVQQHVAGEVIEITVLRDGQEKKLKIKLAERSSVDSSVDRSDVQNQMGGRISRRRLGFPSAIQHDTTLAPNDCGGPLVDLNGNIVGLNIARAGRVDSLALPAATIVSVLEPLRSGELAPTILYKSQIDAVRQRLQEIAQEMAADSEMAALEAELNQHASREDELQKAIGELQSRLSDLQAERAAKEQALAGRKTRFSELQKEKERLEFELQRLQLGDDN